MSFYIHVQETPNPDAVKFISQYTVRSEGKSNYQAAEEAAGNPLAEKLFALDGVKSVFFFDNYITITRAAGTDWNDLSSRVHDLLQEELPKHNPDYVDARPADAEPERELTPELQAMSEILDNTVRPYLAMDGGGITLLEYRDDILFIKYEGACGSCPSSAAGTLQAIQNILRQEYNPEINIVDVGGGPDLFSGY